MNSITQMAEVLGATPQTKQELRAAKNRRYYDKVREMHKFRWKLRRLDGVRQLFPSHDDTTPASVGQEICL